MVGGSCIQDVFAGKKDKRVGTAFVRCSALHINVTKGAIVGGCWRAGFRKIFLARRTSVAILGTSFREMSTEYRRRTRHIATPGVCCSCARIRSKRAIGGRPPKDLPCCVRLFLLAHHLRKISLRRGLFSSSRTLMDQRIWRDHPPFDMSSFQARPYTLFLPTVFIILRRTPVLCHHAY